MPSRTLPAEWAAQDAVLCIWPHADTDWGNALERVEAAMAAFAAAIARFEWLVVVTRDRQVRERALEYLTQAGCNRAAITTVAVDTDDIWARDIAPIPVTDGELASLVQCRFNGWGGRFAHDRDRIFGQRLIDSAGFATLGYERAAITLEGGALESDGAGTLLINRPTVLGPARNPELDADAAEAIFARQFGVERTLWLDVPPLPGDHTDGHIDLLARFCDRQTIAHTAAGEADDDAAQATHEQLVAQLSQLRTPEGEPYRLIPLAAPEPIRDHDGTPRPASYANFLLINDAVLVPVYADPADTAAIESLQSTFPERTAVPVPARTFIEQGGALHCLTMPLPEGALQDLALS